MLKTLFNLLIFSVGIMAFGVLIANAEQIAVKDRIDFFGGDNVPLNPNGQVKKCKGIEKWLKVEKNGNFEVVQPDENSPIEHQNAWKYQQEIWRVMKYNVD